MAEHSKFSPSSAYRWTKCPASIYLSSKMPPQESGQAAKDGTDAHELAELCFNTNLSAHFYIGRIMKFGSKVGQTMADKIQGFVDYVNFQTFQSPGSLEIETRVYLKEIDDRLFGTCDALLISPGRDKTEIHVFDLKYGKWPVDPYANEQLMIYALGAIERVGMSSPDLNIYAHIYQPNSSDRRISKMAKYELQDLMDFKNVVKDAINASDRYNPDGNGIGYLFDGEHCRFCPAELFCPKLNAIGRHIF